MCPWWWQNAIFKSIILQHYLLRSSCNALLQHFLLQNDFSDSHPFQPSAAKAKQNLFRKPHWRLQRLIFGFAVSNKKFLFKVQTISTCSTDRSDFYRKVSTRPSKLTVQNLVAGGLYFWEFSLRQKTSNTPKSSVYIFSFLLIRGNSKLPKESYQQLQLVLPFHISPQLKGLISSITGSSNILWGELFNR